MESSRREIGAAAMQGRPHLRKRISSWMSLGGKDKEKSSVLEHGNLFKTKSSPGSSSQSDLQDFERSESAFPLERSRSGDFITEVRDFNLNRGRSDENSAYAGDDVFAEAGEDFTRSRSSLDGKASLRMGTLDRSARSQPRSPWRKGKHALLFRGSPKARVNSFSSESGDNSCLETSTDGDTVLKASNGVDSEKRLLSSVEKNHEGGLLLVSRSGNSQAGNGVTSEAEQHIMTSEVVKGQHMKKPQRVISLLGAVSEVIGMLGLESVMVGRSHECTRPSSILKLPCVSSPSFGDSSCFEASAVVDSKVRELLKKGLARYSLDVDAIRDLQPDLIITQDTCSVCAVSLEEVQEAAKEFLSLPGSSCEILFLRHTKVLHVWENIRQIAKSLGEPGKGEILLQELQNRWESAKARIPLSVSLSPPVQVACLQWLDPLMGAGFWVPEIIQSAAGLSVTGQEGEPTGVISLEHLNNLDPDVIIVMCCGYGLDTTTRELANFERRKEWVRLRAVISGRVFVTDGSRYFNTSGPSIVDSLEMVVEILHGRSNEFQSFEGSGFFRWKSNGRGASSPARSTRSPGKPSHVLALSDDLEAALEGFRLPKDSPLNWIRSSSFEKDYTGKTGQSKLEDEGSNGGGLDRKSKSDGNWQDVAGSVNGGENVLGTGKKSDLRIENDILDILIKETNSKKSAEYLDDMQLLERLAEVGPGGGGSRRGESIDYEKGSLMSGKPGVVQRSGWLQAPKPPRWGPPSPTGRDSTLQFGTLGSKSGREVCESGNKAENGEGGGVGDAVSLTENNAASVKQQGETIGLDGDRDKLGSGSQNNNTKPIAHVDEATSDKTVDRAALCVQDPMALLIEKEGIEEKDRRNNIVVSSVPSIPLVLRSLLLRVLSESEPAGCLLLSGGLASDVLAEAWKGGFKTAITVACGSKAVDKPHATAVAMKVGLPHSIISQRPIDLLEAELKFVVRTLRTFDPMEVRCGLALAGALRLAQQQGFSSVVTGDGAEELFTGYSFMTKMTEVKLQECRQHMVEYLRYPARALGEALGLKVLQPFLHEDVRHFALGLSKGDLMGETLTAEGGPAGKLVLRQAFPEVYAANRQKEQIEVGAGTSTLKRTLSRLFSPDDFRIERNRIRKDDRIRLRDAEQLYYYRAFRIVFGGPDIAGIARFGPEACVACGYPPMFPDQLVCSTCGEFPARKTHKKTGLGAPEASKSGQVTEENKSVGSSAGRNVPSGRPSEIPRASNGGYSKGRESMRQGEIGGKTRHLAGNGMVGDLRNGSLSGYHKSGNSGIPRNRYQTPEEDGLMSKSPENEFKIKALKDNTDNSDAFHSKTGSISYKGEYSCQCSTNGQKVSSGMHQCSTSDSSGQYFCSLLLEGTGQTLMEAGKGGALEEQGVGALLDSIDNGLGAWHEMIYGDSEASSEGGSVIEIDVASRTESEGDEETRGEMGGESAGPLEGTKTIFVPREPMRSNPPRSSLFSNRMSFPSKQGR